MDTVRWKTSLAVERRFCWLNRCYHYCYLLMRMVAFGIPSALAIVCVTKPASCLPTSQYQKNSTKTYAEQKPPVSRSSALAQGILEATCQEHQFQHKVTSIPDLSSLDRIRSRETVIAVRSLLRVDQRLASTLYLEEPGEASELPVRRLKIASQCPSLAAGRDTEEFSEILNKYDLAKKSRRKAFQGLYPGQSLKDLSTIQLVTAAIQVHLIDSFFSNNAWLGATNVAAGDEIIFPPIFPMSFTNRDKGFATEKARRLRKVFPSLRLPYKGKNLIPSTLTKGILQELFKGGLPKLNRRDVFDRSRRLKGSEAFNKMVIQKVNAYQVDILTNRFESLKKTFPNMQPQTSALITAFQKYLEEDLFLDLSVMAGFLNHKDNRQILNHLRESIKKSYTAWVSSNTKKLENICQDNSKLSESPLLVLTALNEIGMDHADRVSSSKAPSSKGVQDTDRQRPQSIMKVTPELKAMCESSWRNSWDKTNEKMAAAVGSTLLIGSAFLAPPVALIFLGGGLIIGAEVFQAVGFLSLSDLEDGIFFQSGSYIDSSREQAISHAQGALLGGIGTKLSIINKGIGINLFNRQGMTAKEFYYQILSVGGIFGVSVVHNVKEHLKRGINPLEEPTFYVSTLTSLLDSLFVNNALKAVGLSGKIKAAYFSGLSAYITTRYAQNIIATFVKENEKDRRSLRFEAIGRFGLAPVSIILVSYMVAAGEMVHPSVATFIKIATQLQGTMVKNEGRSFYVFEGESFVGATIKAYSNLLGLNAKFKSQSKEDTQKQSDVDYLMKSLEHLKKTDYQFDPEAETALMNYIKTQRSIRDALVALRQKSTSNK